MTATATHPLLPGFSARSPRVWQVQGLLIYANLIVGLLALLPPGLPDVRPTAPIIALGAVGVWRWSWAGLHTLRTFIYKFIAFPRIRRAAAHAPRPPAIYGLVTSYRMPPELNAAVYGRLLDEVAAFGVPAFIVASVTDIADEMLIRDLLARRRDLPEGTEVKTLIQSGHGKRPAMADALRAIMGRQPAPGSLVILMDGDTLLGHGSIGKTCAVLAALPHVGAATTDNIPLVKGGPFTREWYRVRMAHRDSLMASMSLSRKLLVLTGRFSVFRSEIAATSEFVEAIERDVIDHSRLGQIEMVTGDDKSTWFMVLRRGWDMIYVPDVVVHPVEELPSNSFLRSTVALMVRWYGNMARNNSRALALGPRRCRTFPWLCLLDQRLSMWTSLIGPTAALTLSLQHGYVCILYYMLWVLLSRGAVCLVYFATTGRLHPLFPLTLYYNQFGGAWIKIYMIFHPYRQKWTRQAVRGRAGNERKGRLGRLASTPYMAATIGCFVMGTALVVGTLPGPRQSTASPGIMALFAGPAIAALAHSSQAPLDCGGTLARPKPAYSPPRALASHPCHEPGDRHRLALSARTGE
jgi:glycosyltransferase Alg8